MGSSPVAGLDYFLHRYNTSGFLTTGYTTFGTAWHLWTLGEHYQLYHDTDWLREAAPEIERAVDWIVRQTDKTKRRAPEYGLMPPGVIADWNSFAYHYALNAYYYAALRGVGAALADLRVSRSSRREEAIAEDRAFRASHQALSHAADLRANILRAYRWTQAQSPALPLRDGTWIPHYPSQVHSPGKLADFFPGQDAGRSWCYDVEIGAHQLVPTGVLDPRDREVERIMDHMEDVQFLSDGWFDYPATMNEKDWFDLGGFSKVQPYYTRNCEVYALRDEVKPFVRSYFNTLAAMLNPEVLTLLGAFPSLRRLGQDARDRLFPPPDAHDARDGTRRPTLARALHHQQLAKGRPDAERQQRADPVRPSELPNRIAPCRGVYPGDHPAAHARKPRAGLCCACGIPKAARSASSA